MNTEHTCHESAGRMQFQRRMSPSFFLYGARLLQLLQCKGFLPLGVTIENPGCPTDISSIFSSHVKET